MASRDVTEDDARREGTDVANGARWRPPRPSHARASRRDPHDGSALGATGLDVDATGAIAAISARPPRAAARRNEPMPPVVPPNRLASVARCARGALSPVALCDVLTPPQTSTCALRFMPSLRNASGEGDDPAAVRLWQPAVCLKRVSNTVEKSARGEKKKTRSEAAANTTRDGRDTRGVKQFSADIIWATVSHSS